MLTRTSKGVKEEVQKILVPDVVRLRERGDHTDRLKLIFDHLPFMTSWYHISTHYLSFCELRGEFTLSYLATVLVECPALAHLDLRINFIEGGGL